MGKQYAFWRKPDGTRSKRTDDRHVPRALLNEIGSRSHVENNGAAWADYPVFLYHAALNSLIAIREPDGAEVDRSIASALIHQGVSKAVVESGGGKPIDPTKLLRHIDVLAASHLREAEKLYFVVTSISTNGFPARRIRVEGCEFVPLKSRQAGRYATTLQDLKIHSAPKLKEHFQNSKYQAIRISTAGRTPQAAVNRAIGAANYLRGVWNLLGGNAWGWSIGPHSSPIGVVHLGPLHTLHDTEGRLLSDESFWYEPGYIQDYRLFKPRKGWQEFEQVRRRWMRYIERLDCKSDVKDLFVRYALAMDESSHDLAFLQIWQLIEKITDTVGGKYEETIRRASWIFDDNLFVKDILAALRTRRNMYVHGGASGADMEQVTYMAKGIIDPHLRNLVMNPYKVSSVAEYGRVLSLSRSKSKLQADARRFALIAKHRSGKDDAVDE